MKARFHSLTMTSFIFLFILLACCKDDPVSPSQQLTPPPLASPPPVTPPEPVPPPEPTPPPPAPPVNHIAPVARAGNDTTIYSPFSSVTLNAGASTGSITHYKWELVNAPIYVEIVNYRFDKPKTFISRLVSVGTYEFELTVTDTYGLSSKDIVKITVAEPKCTSGMKEVIIKDIKWGYAWWMEAGIRNVFSHLPANSYIRNIYIKRDASDKWELILPYDHHSSDYGNHHTWEHVEYFEFATWYLIIYPNANTADDTPDVKIEYCN